MPSPSGTQYKSEANLKQKREIIEESLRNTISFMRDEVRYNSMEPEAGMGDNYAVRGDIYPQSLLIIKFNSR